MTLSDDRIEIREEPHDVYEHFRDERQRSLIGTLDDMRATFADLATPYALIVDGQLVGTCAIDDDNQLLSFHVSNNFEDHAARVFAHLLDKMDVVASITSTVDPGFLSLSLESGGRAETLALMYEHIAEPVNVESLDVRPATSTDHPDVVAFDREETGSPASFLEPYLADRIERHELFVVEDEAGNIEAVGECRADSRSVGHAHIGLVVASALRGRGLGTRLMQSLVAISEAHDLRPLCSTGSTNFAAQRVIRRAGFRSRHRVFRVAMRSEERYDGALS